MSSFPVVSGASSHLVRFHTPCARGKHDPLFLHLLQACSTPKSRVPQALHCFCFFTPRHFWFDTVTPVFLCIFCSHHPHSPTNRSAPIASLSASCLQCSHPIHKTRCCLFLGQIHPKVATVRIILAFIPDLVKSCQHCRENCRFSVLVPLGLFFWPCFRQTSVTPSLSSSSESLLQASWTGLLVVSVFVLHRVFFTASLLALLVSETCWLFQSLRLRHPWPCFGIGPSP